MFLELQLKYLLWLQNLRIATNDILTPLFLYITSFGEYFIIITASSIIYWCINKKLGTLIILNSSAALIFNHLLKNTACIYRPWMLDNKITPVPQALPLAGGYSFPSGHSTLAVSCWGCIGFWYRNLKKILIPSIILFLSIAFSRNYLGVHTLQDVIIGLLTATVILIVFHKLLNWCEKEKNRDLILTLIISIIGILITAYTYFKEYPIDYDTLGNILISPEKSKWSGFSKLGLVLGSFWGWYLEQRFVKFHIDKEKITTKIIRALIGMTLLILLISTKSLWKEYLNQGWNGLLLSLSVSLYITFIYPLLYYKVIKKALSYKR